MIQPPKATSIAEKSGKNSGKIKEAKTIKGTTEENADAYNKNKKKKRKTRRQNKKKEKKQNKKKQTKRETMKAPPRIQ